jgi:hypothetical protein
MPRAPVILAVLVVLVPRAVLAGEHDAAFAKTFGIAAAAVREVAGYELPTGNETTHVLIGRYDQTGTAMVGAVLLACDPARCDDRRVDLGAASSIELDGIVDLHGASGARSCCGHASPNAKAGERRARSCI